MLTKLSRENDIANDFVDKLMNNYDQVILDTCSLMYYQKCTNFIKRAIIACNKYGRKIICPLSTVEELKRKLDRTDVNVDAETVIRARKAFELLEKLKKSDAIMFCSSADDERSFTDPNLLTYLIRMRAANNESVAIITFDKNLRKDIELIRNFSSLKPKSYGDNNTSKFDVFRLDEYGNPRLWHMKAMIELKE